MTHWRQPTTHPLTASKAAPSKRVIHGFLDAWEVAFGRPIELIVQHFERRLSELAMSVAQFSIGVFLIFFQESMRAAIFLLGLGIARIIALALNGYWMPHGSYVRVIGCVLGAMVWMQMAISICYHDASEAMPVYATLALLEIVSIYRAIHGLKRWRVHGKAD